MNLTYKQLETSWRDQEAVLSDLFNDQISLKTAAQRLTAIVLPEHPPDQDENEDNDDDDTMAYIEGMWNIIIGSLEEDPKRARTASDLIVCVLQLPPAITQSGKQLCEEGRRVWQDVPRLGMALRDEWSSMLAQRSGVEIIRFVGVNALVGYLMLHDLKLFNYELFALWTMRDALEHPLPVSGVAYKKVKGQHGRSLCSIPAAVALIGVVGELMFSWEHEFEHGPLQDPGGGGPLWNGKHGFCRDRWNLWHERFAELSCDDGLEGIYRDEARKGADLMSSIEQH